MYNEIIQEFQDIAAMFDDDWQVDDIDHNLVCNHTAKNMVNSKLVTPTNKYKARSKDTDANKISSLIPAEPSIVNGNFHSAEFNEATRQYFDIKDTETRKVLLAVNEDDQNRILAALTSKLYDQIIDKVDEIDFGDIPRTKGDITKLPNYDKLVGCIDILKGILKEYKQKTEPVDTLEKAVKNIKERKDLFERAYRYNSEMPILVYSTMTLAVVSGVSYLIATCIEFVKQPANDFAVSLDVTAYRKSKDALMFNNLEKFNKICDNGQLDKVMDGIIRNHMKNFTGAEIGLFTGAVLAAGLVLGIIPVLRELVYFFYYSRTRVADYFEIQANLLIMNAHNLEVGKNIKSQEDKERVASRQLKIADLFKRIANFIAINVKDSETKTAKEIANNTKKYKTNELMDSVPDSASDVIANNQSLF